jgi:hypothetical protein
MRGSPRRMLSSRANSPEKTPVRGGAAPEGRPDAEMVRYWVQEEGGRPVSSEIQKKFKVGYTVAQDLADEYHAKHGNAPAPNEPAPAPTAERGHSFKEGDRVEWLDRDKKRLSGTVRGFSGKYGVEVDVDQIQAAAGVPIGRLETVRSEILNPESRKPSGPRPRRVTVEVEGKTHEVDLTPEQETEYRKAEGEHASKLRHAEHAAGSDKQRAEGLKRAAGMELSAEKRRITGKLTAREAAAAEKAAAAHVPGRRVTVTAADGAVFHGEVVTQPAFGKTKVRLDDGTERAYSHDQVKVSGPITESRPETAPPPSVPEKATNGSAAPAAGETAPPPAPAEKPATFGADNKIFTQERYESAREKMLKKLGELKSGIDPEMISLGIELAGYHIEGKSREWSGYVKSMLEDFSKHAEKIRPYLRSWYEAVRHYPGIDGEGMSSAADIAAFEHAEHVRTTDAERRAYRDELKIGDGLSFMDGSQRVAGTIIGDEGYTWKVALQDGDQFIAKNRADLRHAETPEKAPEAHAEPTPAPEKAAAVPEKPEPVQEKPARAPVNYDDNTIQHFKEGDRVEIHAGHLAGRHGEITKVDKTTWRTHAYGQQNGPTVETKFHYDIKTDNGLTTTSRGVGIRPEGEMPASVTPDIEVDLGGVKRHQDPASVFESISSWQRNERNARDQARRARKPENIRQHLRTADVAKRNHTRLQELFDAWAAEHPEAAAKIRPEPTQRAENAPAQSSSAPVSDAAFEIRPGTHTRDGYKIWTVIPKERSDADTFARWKRSAKDHDGYWSNYNGNGAVKGFVFKSAEDAAAFVKEHSPKAEEAPKRSELTPKPSELAPKPSELTPEQMRSLNAYAEQIDTVLSNADISPQQSEYLWKNYREDLKKAVRRGDEGETPTQVVVRLGKVLDDLKKGKVEAEEAPHGSDSNPAAQSAPGAVEQPGTASPRALDGAPSPEGRTPEARGTAERGSAGRSDESPQSEPESASGGAGNVRRDVQPAPRGEGVPTGESGRQAGSSPGERTVPAEPSLAHPVTDRRNFILSPEDHDWVSTGNKRARATDNLAAIRLVKQLEAEGRLATPEEQRILARYAGYGGISEETFRPYNRYNDPNKHEWIRLSDELRKNVTTAEWNAISNSTQNAHYTAPQIIKPMWDAVMRMGLKDIPRPKILEPSMGVGHFFGMMPEEIRGHARLTGVEKDPITAAIARQLYQDADIQASAFEKAAVPDNYYDLAISNVPFGDILISDPSYTRSKRKFLTSQIHDYFFAKGLDKVRPAGWRCSSPPAAR